MANRIRGRVYIIDSATINLDYLPMPILGVGFYGIDTTARLVLTLASNTLDSIVAMAPDVLGANPWSKFYPMGGWLISDTLRVLQVTAGTGYIYIG